MREDKFSRAFRKYDNINPMFYSDDYLFMLFSGQYPEKEIDAFERENRKNGEVFSSIEDYKIMVAKWNGVSGYFLRKV